MKTVNELKSREKVTGSVVRINKTLPVAQTPEELLAFIKSKPLMGEIVPMILEAPEKTVLDSPEVLVAVRNNPDIVKALVIVARKFLGDMQYIHGLCVATDESTEADNEYIREVADDEGQEEYTLRESKLDTGKVREVLEETLAAANIRPCMEHEAPDGDLYPDVDEYLWRPSYNKHYSLDPAYCVKVLEDGSCLHFKD